MSCDPPYDLRAWLHYFEQLIIYLHEDLKKIIQFDTFS